MHTNMTTPTQYKDFTEFLTKHSAKNVKAAGGKTAITHTRIPDDKLNIYGGSYIIPKEEKQVFYDLYVNHIFNLKRKEYLTEKQLDEGGPMAVDFDFRYAYEVETRQHTKNDVTDMICAYLDELKKCYVFEENKPFPIFIFEKPNVNRLEDGSLTKDGIHMIIGMQVDHTMQQIIRERMINELESIWSLPLINSYDSVLDDGISKGVTNWQLFGSRKPGNEAYELTYYFIINYDSADSEFMMDERKITDFDMKKDFAKLSVQYDAHPKFEISNKIKDEYDARMTGKVNKLKKKNSGTKLHLIEESEYNDDEDYVQINDIVDHESLQKAVNYMLKNLKSSEYEIKETHEFTQILPKRFYEPGSHLLNRQVAFALKQTDDRLFISWIQLRSRAEDFDFATIPALYLDWKKFHKTNNKNERVTRRSIMYWVKKENFEEYEKIKNSTIDYYIEKSIETGTEYDMAVVLKQIYKDNYVCVSYDKKGIWYRFKNHRWTMDKGLSLREKISTEMYNLYNAKLEKLENELFDYNDDEDRKEFIRKRIKVLTDVKIKLKKTADKNNIMREAAEIFYDDDFVRSMDTNKFLLGFNNGVIDFKAKTFRDGLPEDYLTKTTGINYIPFNLENEDFKRTHDELWIFMQKLFPIEDLRCYMFEHLASCLIGDNKNQTFNVYHGSGSNGKSILADLMSATLGDYKGVVPITLVTDRRGKIGGTSDEVLKLKGVRYAVMQEPSKDVKLNEGIMKELTGGDPLQARGLFMESEVFDPQFTLVVCTNNLFDIESNDDGTWRRIRKCIFPSKFVNEEDLDEYIKMNPDIKYIFVKDKTLKEKLPSLAPIFASMLVHKAFETDGFVKDCATVNKASAEYRNNQDCIGCFIASKIEKTGNPEDKIKKTSLMQEFRIWMQNENTGKKVPKGEELYEYMSQKFGEINKNDTKHKAWVGVRFVQPDDEDDEIIN